MPIYSVKGKKKDGLQQYRVRVNYTNDMGEAKQLTRVAYGKEEAKDLERKLNYEVKHRGANSINRMTVQELANEYFKAKESEVRESTLEKKIFEYKRYVQPMMADVRLDKLTIPLLQKWKNWINEKELAISTKKNAYAIFRSILYFAERMEYIHKNPLPKVGNFRDNSFAKPKMKIYTAEEFKAFIKEAKRRAVEVEKEKNSLSEWDSYIFFKIAFYTGFRKGEIFALKWSDIEGEFLNVTRSGTHQSKGRGFVETDPKNKTSIRTVQMPLPLINALAEHKQRQQKLIGFTEDFYICGATYPIHNATLRERKVKYAKGAGVKEIRIHDFRHSHASLLANTSINIQEIARRLGHSDIKETLNTYAHLYPREEEKAINVLNNL